MTEPQEIPPHERVCGVYRLRWKDNKYFYIGSSQDIIARYYAHIGLLKRGDHENSRMQIIYAQYGIPELETVNVFESKQVADFRETELIKKNKGNLFCLNVKDNSNSKKVEVLSLIIDIPKEILPVLEMVTERDLDSMHYNSKYFVRQDFIDILKNKRGKCGAIQEMMTLSVSRRVNSIVRDAIKAARNKIGDANFENERIKSQKKLENFYASQAGLPIIESEKPSQVQIELFK